MQHEYERDSLATTKIRRGSAENTRINIKAAKL